MINTMALEKAAADHTAPAHRPGGRRRRAPRSADDLDCCPHVPGQPTVRNGQQTAGGEAGRGAFADEMTLDYLDTFGKSTPVFTERLRPP